MFKYAYHGLMINEFDGANFYCKPGALVTFVRASLCTRLTLFISSAGAQREWNNSVPADDGGRSAAVVLHQARCAFSLLFREASLTGSRGQIWSNVLILAALALFIRFVAFLCLVLFAKRHRVTA